MGPLTRRTGYMLRRAYHPVHEQGKAAFKEHDLGPQQFGILLFLDARYRAVSRERLLRLSE